MTTMKTSISNNLYWYNISSDSSFDLAALFSSPYTFIHNNEHNDDSMSIKEDHGETLSSSEIDQKQLQISFTNNPAGKFHLSNLKCAVCGAPATGYNFSQITCGSCKAFFRRNALRDMIHLKCCFTGHCVIDIQSRRQCTYCRLKKCFDMKMRKDWIRTEEEVELRQLQKLAKEQKKVNKLTNNQQYRPNLPIVMRKRKRLMIKPTTEELIIKPINTQTFFGFNRNLCNEDRILLNNITNAYQLVADQAESLHINQYTLPATLIEFLNEQCKIHQSLISFYKLIPDFNELDIEDRVLLIKFNIHQIVHLQCILIQNFQENPLLGKYMSRWIDKNFHNQMSRTRRYFDRFIEHPLVLKLAIIVLIFSFYLSTPSDIDRFDEYKNSRKLYELQNYYTTILWRYLNHVFEEKEAIHALEIIVMQILRYQKLMIALETHIRHEPHHNILHSLMQSILRLS